MTTTGYSDTFNRTVSGGLGSATSGQAYTLNGTASQFSVAPNTATIAMNALNNWLGLLDRQTSDIDVSGQVALTAIPASNLATVGYLAKATGNANLYAGTMMVATGGAVSLRFSKVIAGGLVTLATVAVTGLTYVANTFYNLRFQCYWSSALQTNVLNVKLWAVGATQPGGWMATTTDNALTSYTSGTQSGLYARDESSVQGSVSAKFQALATVSYALPMPATTDPMCADPAVAYPKQTALQSLASAADTATATIDPLVSLAGLFPRVRVSTSSAVLAANFFITPTFGATEFNVGTPTNLGYNNQALYLPVGIWLVTFEIRFVEASSTAIQISLNGTTNASSPIVNMRQNAVQLNDLGVGGCGHVSALVYSTDPTTPVQITASLSLPSAVSYTIAYAALSAVKISDYF